MNFPSCAKLTAGLMLMMCLARVGLAESSEEDGILPLPSWVSEGLDQSSSVPFLGGALLPQPLGDDGLDPAAPRLPAQPPSLAGGLEESRSESDLSLFLPDALLSKTIHLAQPVPPTPTAALKPLSVDFLERCRHFPTDEHLIDPDSHVAETQREDLLRFLEFHARDARIKAYVMVTDRDQTLPMGADLSGVASGALGEHDACLAVYPLGEPWRTRVFLSQSIHQQAASGYLDSLVEDCARDAMLATDPHEQLHRFSVRLSIRLFWLQKVLAAARPAVELAAEGKSSNLLPSIIAEREQALTEALAESNAVIEPTFLRRMAAGIGSVLTLAAGIATIVAIRRHRRRLLSHVWLLPEIEVEPRLGGAFSGGGGACIQYR